MAERSEWVEIIEPRTKEPMYANLKTGQCLWEPPDGIKVKKADETHWWELYDPQTRRYYYYNACSQTTVWHKPKDCDIIPLAKLQAMKAKEKKRLAKLREERKESGHRREGSDRRKRESSRRERGDTESPGASRSRRDGRKDSSRRERTSTRERQKGEQAAEVSLKQMGLNSTAKDGDEQADEPAARRDSNHDNATTSPGTSRHPSEGGPYRDQNGDGPGRVTPSGTLTRNEETIDVKLRREPGDVTPSGTLERDKANVTSPSGSFAGHTSIYDNLDSLPAPPSDPISPVDSPLGKGFTLNGDIQLDEHDRASSEESLSYRLQAGGMSATTALLVEACSPPPSENGVRSLRHQRQTSDSAVALAYREEQERIRDLELGIHGSSSTLPRLSRPSSIATTQGSPSHHSTLERSHSVPSGKPPLFRGLGAYESCLNQHTKGLFRRKRVSLASMMSWSKVPIKKPLILMSDRQLKRDAVDVFKLILGYMGDRPVRGKTTLEIALDITTMGWGTPLVRDEIFLQLCKQTTDNGRQESLQRGWELMAICLTLFPPSTKFHTYLESYITRHLNCEEIDFELQVEISEYARHCHKQLAKISKSGAKRGVKKPTVDDIQQAEYNVFHPSMFGSTLDDIMERQVDDFPSLKLPWILTTLAEAVLQHDGARTEGIFRIPGDIDEVNALKLRLDRYETPDSISDPHVPASLLKLWFRELNDPLIPPDAYDKCVMNCDDATVATALILSLPEINRLVLSYLVRFLQIFSLTDVSNLTKMDVNNLSMVWAPNCLRNPSDNLQEVWENTRREMTFMRTLLWNLDTSYMEGVR